MFDSELLFITVGKNNNYLCISCLPLMEINLLWKKLVLKYLSSKSKYELVYVQIQYLL